MARFRGNVSTYHDALEFLAGREYRKIAHNTWVDMLNPLYDGTPCVGVRYHSTTIVRLYPGVARISTGGYDTVTTKQRLNAVLRPLNWNVYQQDYEWFVVSPGGVKYPFAEDMDIHLGTGKVMYPLRSVCYPTERSVNPENMANTLEVAA